jgi:hypothetical protein
MFWKIVLSWSNKHPNSCIDGDNRIVSVIFNLKPLRRIIISYGLTFSFWLISIGDEVFTMYLFGRFLRGVRIIFLSIALISLKYIPLNVELIYQL